VKYIDVNFLNIGGPTTLRRDVSGLGITCFQISTPL
jgi:hypothetical protein